MSWAELIAFANTQLDRWQGEIELAPDRVSESHGIHNIIAAARILDMVSQDDSVELSADERRDLALLAALAYAMYGNFPAAAAVDERWKNSPDPMTDGHSFALGASVPRSIGRLRQHLQQGSPTLRVLDSLASMVATGDRRYRAVLNDGLAEVVRSSGSALEMSLVELATGVLEALDVLNARRVLDGTALATRYVESVTSHVRVLMPPQFEAIRAGLLDQIERDVVISLPTSTGKTLLGELALMRAVGESSGLAVYVTPYVALGAQVRDQLRRHLPPEVHLSGLFGGYQAEAPLDPSSRPEMVVATPERLDALLRTTPGLMGELRCVVFDEFHKIAEPGRGFVIEGLLARLKLIRRHQAVTRPRVVLMSAVVANAPQIGSWVGEDTLVVTGDWRPAAQRLAVWSEAGRISWFSGRDVLTEDALNPSEVIGVQELPWPNNGFFPTKHYGAQQKQQRTMSRNVAYLSRYLVQSFNDAVLCVCATRRSSRLLAEEAKEFFDELEPVPSEVLAAEELIEQRYKHLRPLASLMRRGIAYHNASLPIAVRERIERAARDGSLRLVTATTTLAEGVDLPFRFTVVADWLMWGPLGVEVMSPLLFANIAGRSGRAGMHTEGDTILVDNPVGDPEFVSSVRRPKLLRQVLGFDELPAVTSSLGISGLVGLPASNAAMSSQFLAAIPENSNSTDLATEFMETTLVGRSPDVAAAIQRVEDDILSSDEEPLALAASPLVLTDSGRSAVATGLSAPSFRSLLAWLRSDASSRSDLAETAGALLRAVWRVAEQPSHQLRKIMEGKRPQQFYVREPDLEGVVGSWLGGLSYLDIFVELPAVKRSQRQDRLDVWLAGEGPSSSWYDAFDSFVRFVDDVMAEFLPWMCRSAGVVARDESTTGPFDWDELALFLEVGVDTRWALQAVRSNAPADRRVVVEFGRAIASDLGAAADMTTAGVMGINLEAVTSNVFQHLADIPTLSADVEAMDRWIRDGG